MKEENKEIKNYNDKGQFHGYQEWYWYNNDKLWFRGNFKNKILIGYNENHLHFETNFDIR